MIVPLSGGVLNANVSPSLEGAHLPHKPLKYNSRFLVAFAPYAGDSSLEGKDKVALASGPNLLKSLESKISSFFHERELLLFFLY